MSSRESETLIRTGYMYFKSLENYREIVEKVKELALARWPKAELYIFGSIARGKYTASSDLDILIVLDKRPSREEEYLVKAEIYSRINAPVELHVASIDEFERWYKKFIDKDLIRISP